MKKNRIRLAVLTIAFLLCTPLTLSVSEINVQAADSEKTITLKVCNWEEYIDNGDWDEDETIELANGKKIIGVNSIMDDFEEWYYEKYGVKVNVEYSCFGTNEDLYNQLTMGDSYDLVCPSEYMIMKLMAEDKLVPYSDEFFDEDNEENYYIKGVSPYIRNVFENNEINGEKWKNYAACYMWGVTGTVYNPDKMSREDASTMTLYSNPKYRRKVTLKDNVRDSYFVTLGIMYKDRLMKKSFIESPDYEEKLADYMNDVDEKTISKAKDLLYNMVDNAYSLETDSGKADMVSGKVYATYQWSGDAVYALDQAEEDDFYLKFAVPEECTNMWFDGWVMLKNGIDKDKEKQKVAESFVNFLSMPENVVRNMYYIGYTSSISGGADDTIYQYIDWCYGDEEGEVEYPLGYFFSGDNDDDRYVLTTNEDQLERQLFAQYPTSEVMQRSAIMRYFDLEENKNINQMWIDVRCYDIRKTPVGIWIFVGVAIVAVIAGKKYFSA